MATLVEILQACPSFVNLFHLAIKPAREGDLNAGPCSPQLPQLFTLDSDYQILGTAEPPNLAKSKRDGSKFGSPIIYLAITVHN